MPCSDITQPWHATWRTNLIFERAPCIGMSARTRSKASHGFTRIFADYDAEMNSFGPRESAQSAAQLPWRGSHGFTRIFTDYEPEMNCFDPGESANSAPQFSLTAATTHPRARGAPRWAADRDRIVAPGTSAPGLFPPAHMRAHNPASALRP